MNAGVAEKLKAFGESIFSEMTRLANEAGAINLSQGFPDFDGPEWLKEEAIRCIKEGPNQYAPMTGHLAFRQAVARTTERCYGLKYDPETEVTVFSGATEAIFSSINGILNPGDEVVLIEPYYDSYPACVVMAGATYKTVPLRGADFHLDMEELEAAFTRRTRLLVLNTPNNPAGKVYNRTELEAIAAIVKKYDALVLTDEVYEHIIFDDNTHLPMAALPGMRERTLMISSTAKTFSMTGWKIGYVLGPPGLVHAARSAHQFVTFSTNSPLQMAMVRGFERLDEYKAMLTAEYDSRRHVLFDALKAAGFGVTLPQGTYFILADIRPLGFEDDVTCARFLTTEVGVAAIPASAFYTQKEHGRHLVRFAFCKNLETLKAAGQRLQKLPTTRRS